MNKSVLLNKDQKDEILEFAQNLVRVKSYSSQEEEAIRMVQQKMIDLGYDEVKIDSLGNVIGRIGNGDKIIMFDSHVDTVEVNDGVYWMEDYMEEGL
jgi:acetylornithine deacetylase/succinyl-diaminopimelate desuccinylase-like protein